MTQNNSEQLKTTQNTSKHLRMTHPNSGPYWRKTDIFTWQEVENGIYSLEQRQGILEIPSLRDKGHLR